MTSASRVTILYEDDRGPTKGFGLHVLVKMCVYDRVQGERYLVEAALDGRPMKGDSKLLESCRQDIADIAADGRSVVAVFDADRIRRLLKLSHDSPATEVVKVIKTGCVVPEVLTVILLERNTETVLAALGKCDPTVDRDQLRRAVDKNRSDRDALLAAAAREPMRSVRDCILAAVPSLKGLIEHLSGRISPSQASASPEPLPTPQASRRRTRPRK